MPQDQELRRPIITRALAFLFRKLGIYGAIAPLRLHPEVMCVIPLNSFGFFQSDAGSLTTTSAAGVNPIISTVCPTNKIRRVIACSMATLAGANWTDAQIQLVSPDGTVVTTLATYSLDGNTARLRILKDFLWGPGFILRSTANFGVANQYTQDINYYEEDVGIAPTG